MEYQEKSEIFWKKSVDSHLALPEFYQRKRHYLAAIVEHLPAMKSGLDIGCGNGEYTAMMLPKWKSFAAMIFLPVFWRKRKPISRMSLG